MWIDLTMIIVIVLSIALMSAIYVLYDRAYRYEARHALERSLATWYDRADDRTSRDDMLKLRDAIGLGIDSLPSVRFGAAKDEYGRLDASTVDPDADERDRRQQCLSTGVYVSPLDDYVDCRMFCHVSDGVDYRYYDRAGLLIDGRRGRTGSYCLPTDAALCNTNTSILVYTGSKDGWRCMPQTRAFAGEGGNRIVVCDGSLLDLATGITWRESIDSTLRFTSIDELLTNGKDYRFVCPSSKDRVGNDRVEAPLDRLIQLDNYCAALIPHAIRDIQPNFRTGQCECASTTREDPTSRMCVPYDIRFDAKTYETTLSVEPCVETWSVRSIFHSDTFRDLIPCGVEYHDADRDSSDTAYPSYLSVRTMAFDRVVPSPYAMSESRE